MKIFVRKECLKIDLERNVTKSKKSKTFGSLKMWTFGFTKKRNWFSKKCEIISLKKNEKNYENLKMMVHKKLCNFWVAKKHEKLVNKEMWIVWFNHKKSKSFGSQGNVKVYKEKLGFLSFWFVKKSEKLYSQTNVELMVNK